MISGRVESRRAQYLSALSPSDYAWMVRRGWRTAVALGLAGLAVSLVWVYFYPERYVSQATLRFIPPQVAERYVAGNDTLRAEERVYAVSQLLSSTLTARKLIDGLGLYPELRRIKPVADLVPIFQSNLAIERVSSGNQGRSIASARISFQYSDAEKCRQIVQQLVETVYEVNRRYRGEQSIGTTEFLATQVEAARATVDELEEKLAGMGMSDRLLGDHQWVLNTQQLFNIEYRLGQIQAALRNLNRERGDRIEQLRDIERRLRQGGPDNVEHTSYEHILLQDRMRQAQATLGILRNRYQEGHPDLPAAEESLRNLQETMRAQEQRDLERERAVRREGLLRDQERLKGELVSVESTIRAQQVDELKFLRQAEGLRAAIAPSADGNLEYLQAQRDYLLARDNYQALVRKQQESESAKEMDRLGRGESIELIEPPVRALHPKQPNTLVRLIFGPLAGLLLGWMAHVVAGLWRPRLRQEQHLELLFEVPLLAHLPGELRPAAGTRVGSGWRRAARLLPLLLLVAMTGCQWPGSATKEQLLARASRPGAPRAEAMLLCRRALQQDARYGPAWERLAELQWQDGDAEASFASLTRAAELLPERLDLQVRLANLQYQAYLADPGRPRLLLQEVEALADRMRARWPKRAEGYRLQGLVLTERHRLDEALAAIDEGLRAAGRDAELEVQRASIRFRQGRREEAIALLRGLVESGVRYAQAYELLYLQLMQARRTEEAGRVLEAKYRSVADADSALQYAAHLYASGRRAESRAVLTELTSRFPGERNMRARVGDFWLNRGELEEARAAYEEGLAKHPEARGLYAGRQVELLLAREDRAGARRLLEQELRRSPQDDVLMAWRAVLGAEGADATALRKVQLDLETLASRMPGSAFVRYHLGRVYMQLGDLTRAGQSLERSVRLDPNYAPGWLALAQSDMARGNWTLAQTRMDTLLARAPAYGPALLTQARLDARRGEYEKAVRALDALHGPADFEAEVSLARGEIQSMRGDWSGAAASFERVVQNGLVVERAVLELARLDLRQGRGRKGLDRLAEALRQRPESVSLRLGRAALALECGDSEAALQEYRALLARDPQRSEYRLGEADALAVAGRWKEARTAYQSLAETGQAGAQPLIRYAALLTVMGDRADAVEAYRKALARDGNNPYALNNLAYLLARGGEQLSYALQLAQQADRILPGSAEVQDTLAYVYLRLGMKQEAAGVLARMERSAPPGQRAQVASRARRSQTAEAPAVVKEMEQERDRRAASQKAAAL